jgi:hypothetical protein
MITFFINKLMFLIFFMAILNAAKHLFEVVRRLFIEDQPERYTLTRVEKILLGLSIAYILTTIFTGIKL